MPGFEVIGSEERDEVDSIFSNGGVLFRHGFDAIRNGSFKVQQFERDFADYMGAHDALACTSGTAALRLALAALDVGPGDEVITQSFTFVATVEAIVESGATPVSVDIDKDLYIDLERLESAITEHTKAVIVVHMLGSPCDMRALVELCKRHELALIEDTAWGCGGTVENLGYLGTIGDIGCFSFDYAKTITTGEGGMVIAKNSNVLDKAKAWHDHGHENNPRVPRWEDTRSSSGFNFRLSELQGAVGIQQLKKLEKIVTQQNNAWDRCAEIVEAHGSFKVRHKQKNATETCDAFIIKGSSSEAAADLRSKLIAAGLATKILPEAITWHFAGDWTHIPSLKHADGNFSCASRKILSRHVALPISLKYQDDFYNRLTEVLKKT